MSTFFLFFLKIVRNICYDKKNLASREIFGDAFCLFSILELGFVFLGEFFPIEVADLDVLNFEHRAICGEADLAGLQGIWILELGYHLTVNHHKGMTVNTADIKS